MSDKEYAVELLDRLAASQLAAVVHLLETIVPPEVDSDTPSHAERSAHRPGRRVAEAQSAHPARGNSGGVRFDVG
jgi:hypothetical protein